MIDKERKSAFAKRLNTALDLREYPALGDGRITYVQEVFELSRAGANKWIHGEAIPHRKKRRQIAEKLGINLTWLETGSGDPLSIDEKFFSPQSNVREVPVLNTKEACYFNVKPQDLGSRSVITLGASFNSKCFAVEICGNSMAPRFNSGTIIIVDPTSEIHDGDYVLARLNNFPEAIFRQYVFGHQTKYLVAINIKFEPVVADDCKILGKVIEFRSKI